MGAGRGVFSASGSGDPWHCPMTNNAGSRRSSGRWTGHGPGFAAGGSDNQRRERRWVAAAAVLGVGLVVLLTGLVLTQGSVTLGVIVVVAGMSIVTAAVALFIDPRDMLYCHRLLVVRQDVGG